MNKVDKLIKKMMLSYPSLFNDRLRCLFYIFMVNGSGYSWTEDGCIEEDFGEPNTNNQMSYDDLYRRLRDCSLDLEKFPHVKDLILFQKLQIEKELLLRQFTEKNIDILCRFNDNNNTLSYSDINLFYPEKSMFSTAPYGSINEDWLNAMEELVGKILIFFSRAYPSEETSNMPDNLQRVYIKVLEIESKLDAQSGTKTRRKQFLDSLKEITS